MSSRPVAGGRVRQSFLQATAPERVSPSAGSQATPGISEEELPDGELRAKRDAPLGGQAVLEGVMMRGVRHWAVAVRKPRVSTSECANQVNRWSDKVRKVSGTIRNVRGPSRDVG
jgi:hypothetical protein